MSGTALFHSAMSTLEDHVEVAYGMAKKWEQPQHNLNDLVELLKIVPAENFVEFSATTFDLDHADTFQFSFAPIIESMKEICEITDFAREKKYGIFYVFFRFFKESNAVKPFMVQWPEDIYKNVSMDVDILFGATSQVKQKKITCPVACGRP